MRRSGGRSSFEFSRERESRIQKEFSPRSTGTISHARVYVYADMSGTDWTKLKVADLKVELEKRGLDSSGKKAELVERLEEAEGGDVGVKNDEGVKNEFGVKTEDAHAAPASHPVDVSPADPAAHDAPDHASPRSDADGDDDGDGDTKTNKRQRTEDGGDPGKKVKKLCRTVFITGFQGQPSEEEVRGLVEKHGKVATLFLPPNSGAALVFYEHSDGATAARKVFDQFEWQGSTLKSAYRNVHQAIKMAKSKYGVTLDVALTEEDPDEDERKEREGDKKKEREKKGDVERAPNPFRQTTTEPVLYWRTVRVYPEV